MEDRGRARHGSRYLRPHRASGPLAVRWAAGVRVHPPAPAAAGSPSGRSHLQPRWSAGAAWALTGSTSTGAPSSANSSPTHWSMTWSWPRSRFSLAAAYRCSTPSSSRRRCGSRLSPAGRAAWSASPAPECRKGDRERSAVSCNDAHRRRWRGAVCRRLRPVAGRLGAHAAGSGSGAPPRGPGGASPGCRGVQQRDAASRRVGRAGGIRTGPSGRRARRSPGALGR